MCGWVLTAFNTTDENLAIPTDMTIREQVLGMADDQGLLRPDQAHRVINAHLLPFSDYCEETGCDFRAEEVLTWLGY